LYPASSSVGISGRVGDRFEFAIPPDQALDAFYHPFAHAA